MATVEAAQDGTSQPALLPPGVLGIRLFGRVTHREHRPVGELSDLADRRGDVCAESPTSVDGHFGAGRPPGRWETGLVKAVEELQPGSDGELPTDPPGGAAGV